MVHTAYNIGYKVTWLLQHKVAWQRDACQQCTQSLHDNHRVYIWLCRYPWSQQDVRSEKLANQGKQLEVMFAFENQKQQ